MLKSTFSYLLKVIAAAYIGLLLMVITITPLRFITQSATVEGLLSCAICVLSSMVTLFLLCIKEGHHDRVDDSKPINGKIVVAMSLAVFAYILLTVLFRYGTGAATNVSSLAGLMGADASDIEERVAQHGGLMFTSLLIQTIPFFIPSMIVGYLVGGNKRKKERDRLLGR